LVAALGLGAGSATAQDDPKTSEKLPFPRVVSNPAKSKPDAKKEEPKKEEPKKEEAKKLTFEKVPEPPAEKKEIPKAEAPKEEAKKDEPKEPGKEEPKKDDPKPDPVAVAKKMAEDAGLTGPTGTITQATQRADNAWVLCASALVLLMTPGLALFYGGMVRKKNVLATMMQSYAAMAIVGLYWVAVGYGLAFGPSQIKVSLFGVEDGGVIGWDWKLFFLQGIDPQQTLPGYNIPIFTHVMFQGMFAIITPALISGAIA